MLATIGDLIDDVVVRLGGPVQLATDTAARIQRRRGGSAANVAAAAAEAGVPSRFIGQVGQDDLATILIAGLQRAGVDVRVRRAGRTGTVIALVDHEGERTMLTDRAACTELTEPDPAWLDAVTMLHVPLYSLVVEPLATTTSSLIDWTHRANAVVSVDASSVGAMSAFGRDASVALLRAARPAVLFCNADEAAFLAPHHEPAAIGCEATVVKRGPDPASLILRDGATSLVPALVVAGVTDTTGAGDAFAGGFLAARYHGADFVGAVGAGHQAAARLLRAAR